MDRITCTVESIFPFGVFVRAADGQKYYIRRRELTLSGNVDPQSVVKVGQRLLAVPIPSDGSTPELSVRDALGDPWPAFSQTHRPGDVVTATVKHLFAEGALVEVLPGVDGYIFTRDLTSGLAPAKPDDILWPSDHVEATILRINRANKLLTLSIRRRIEQLVKADGLKEQFNRVAREPAADAASDDGPIPSLPDMARIELGGPVLVVEDQDDIREPLLTWLRERGCEAYGAASGEAAIALCDAHTFAFGLFDLDIPGMNGASSIQKLRELQHKMPVAVMSGPDLIAEQWATLRPLDIVACFAKPLDLDELHQTLRQIGRGESPQLSPEFAGDEEKADVIAFQSLTAALNKEYQMEARLKLILQQAVDDTQADKGIIFRFDPAADRVMIVAEVGQQRLSREAIYLLPESPVRDVIRGSKVFHEKRASTGRTRRLQNLEALLSFEAVLGVHLEAGGRTEHALFLFARLPDAFSHAVTRRQVLSAAYMMRAVLESHILEERLEAAGGVLLSGHLSSAFGHEVFNKIQSLDLQMTNLAQDLRKLQEDGAPAGCQDKLAQAADVADATMQAVTELRQIVQDFQRMMRKTDERSVDVNQILAITESQVRRLALRYHVHLDFDLAEELPEARVNSVHIQQVFMNLLLNAIQHLTGVDDSRRRVVRVSSRRAAGEQGPRVHVRFSDTGPGIHRQNWDKIFAMGFTTREGGSGLGLFIARSLVQAMGGQIAVEESLVPLGTTFLVDLPATPGGQGGAK